MSVRHTQRSRATTAEGDAEHADDRGVDQQADEEHGDPEGEGQRDRRLLGDLEHLATAGCRVRW